MKERAAYCATVGFLKCRLEAQSFPNIAFSVWLTGCCPTNDASPGWSLVLNFGAFQNDNKMVYILRHFFNLGKSLHSVQYSLICLWVIFHVGY